MRYHEVVLNTDIFSLFEFAHKYSERLTFIDVQESVRLSQVEEQSDDDDRYSIDSGEHQDEPTKEMTWHLPDLQNSGRRATLALHAIQDLLIKCKVNERADLIQAQAIIGDGISSIPVAVELMCQLTERKETGLTYKKEHKTEAAWLNDLASRRILTQRKTSDTLEYAPGGVFSLAASLKRAQRRLVMFQGA